MRLRRPRCRRSKTNSLLSIGNSADIPKFWRLENQPSPNPIPRPRCPFWSRCGATKRYSSGSETPFDRLMKLRSASWTRAAANRNVWTHVWKSSGNIGNRHSRISLWPYLNLCFRCCNKLLEIISLRSSLFFHFTRPQ